MRATLPMYDLPVLRAATDRWWQGLARHLRAAGLEGVPNRLARRRPPSWTDPTLLFSQTCGYPLTHTLAGRVEPLCTPVYTAPACTGARYASIIAVRADSTIGALTDLRGTTCAINARDSHSGCNVLRHMLAPLAGGEPLFAKVVETGGHVASLARVGAGAADVCAIDAVTHELLRRHAPPALAGTRVLSHSPTAPGLPYIAGPAVGPRDRARMRAGVHAALGDPALAGARATLLIAGAEALPIGAYEEIPAMEHEAAALGYPILR